MNNLDRIKIGERLRAFLQARFGNVSAGAKALDIKHSSLHSAYLTGRSIPGGEILSELELMGCSISWLLRGEGDMMRADERGSGADISYIPIEIAEDHRYNVNGIPAESAKEAVIDGIKIIGAIPAGFAEFTYFFEESVQFIKPAFNPASHFAIIIDRENGISMAPTLTAGDIAIASLNDTPVTGDLVAAAFTDECGNLVSGLKIVHFPANLNIVGFSSGNPTIPTVMVTPENIKKIYRIIAVIKPKNRTHKTT